MPNSLSAIPLEGVTQTLVELTISANQQQLLGYDGVTWYIWNTTDGKLLRSIKLATPEFNSVAWSTDQQKLAFGLANGGIEVISLANGQLLAQSNLSENYDQLNSLAWSPNGQILAAGYSVRVVSDKDYYQSQPSPVRLWDANNGNLKATLTGHTDRVMSVSWSPDGQYLASAAGREIRLWRPDGKPVTTYGGDLGSLDSLAWSQAGSFLAGSNYNELLVWSLNN